MLINNKKWLKRFYSQALTIRTWSKDPDRQVGAVAVAIDGRSFSPGYNGLPKGVEDSQDILYNKELKNALTVHAEVNAILNAKTDLSGWYLFVTCFPCTHCAAVIIQSGISTVVCPKPDINSTRHANQQRAATLLALAKVQIIEVNENGK